MEVPPRRSFQRIYLAEFFVEFVLAFIERIFDVFGFAGYAFSSGILTGWLLWNAYRWASPKPSLNQVAFFGLGSWALLLLLYPGSRPIRVIVRQVIVTPTPTPTPMLTGYTVCADAPPSLFRVGDQAWQCMESGLIVRARPSLRAQAVAVVRDARFRIIGGPECGFQRVWWRIETFDRSVRGWVPETDPGGSERYLCPLETAP